MKKVAEYYQQQSNKTATSYDPCPSTILPITGWKTFPSVDVPKDFNYGHIHHHIAESVQFVHIDKDVSEDDEFPRLS